jgi:hypothetical protein
VSLGIVIKGPEGVVLAADSRVTLEAKRADGAGFVVNFDNATKLLSFSAPHNYVGAVTYGAAVIDGRTAHSFIPEFELSLPKARVSVEEYAKLLSAFYFARWKDAIPADYKGASMTFAVGGYSLDAAYGSAFMFDIPHRPDPVQRNPGPKDFGMTWGGQLEIVSRIIHGYDPVVPALIKETLKPDDTQMKALQEAIRSRTEFRIPYQVLPLQDCVDLAVFMIRTTITAQALAVGIRGVGGPIDVATVTRTSGLEYIQRKRICAERLA